MQRRDSVNMLSKRAESWILDLSVFCNHSRKLSLLTLALWVRVLHLAVSSVKDSKFLSRSTLRIPVPWRLLKAVPCTESKETRSRSSAFQLTYKFSQAQSLRQSSNLRRQFNQVTTSSVCRSNLVSTFSVRRYSAILLLKKWIQNLSKILRISTSQFLSLKIIKTSFCHHKLSRLTSS